VGFGRSRTSKVDDFGTNQNCICDFVLVGHCDYGPILHRFWDMATYWPKIAYFSYPSLIRRPHSLCSLWNFALKLTVRKLVMGLSSSGDRMIVAWVSVWQTDGRIDYSQYSALHSKLYWRALKTIYKIFNFDNICKTRSSATAEKQRVSYPHGGGGARPASPLPRRPLWLHLYASGRIRNPQQTYFRPLSAL